ncbi:MAG TPA: glucose-6-phosphate isomerase [Micromonosporaceae bacterium]
MPDFGFTSAAAPDQADAGAPEGAAGLAVRGADTVPGAATARRDLTDQSVAGLLAEKDPSLWGRDAQSEAEIRLGWVDTFRRSRDLLPRLAALKDALAGLFSAGPATPSARPPHVVLAGMGGSSLAPEVITRTLGVPLTVLDTTDPHQVRAALADRLDRTVVVVASKSGSTVETDAHRRAYWQAFVDAGVEEPAKRFVVVTDPGSPLEKVARDAGMHIVLADPDVGGRYSALTAFGLVPAYLAGVKVDELLDQADELAGTLGNDEGVNPGLALGAAIGAAALAGRDKLALVDDGTGITGLGDWIEQLIAESTGKQGTGILPVVVENPSAPGATGPDVLTVTFGGALPPIEVPGRGVAPDISVNGPLGAQFLVWEAATAFAGRLLGINPFDQPNVTESKENTNHILADGLPAEEPSFVDGAVQGFGSTASTLDEALAWLVSQVPDHGYLAVMAYLDRVGDAPAAGVRPALAQAAGRPVTFGWGPRFLHSTGQYHKGGPQVGAFLQVTGAVTEDLPVPDRPYTFGQLQAAQAAGDRVALASRNRPLLRLHLTDRAAGLAQLLLAVGRLQQARV